ncbi:class I SAM-dependent methyltransferase [Halorarius litoreus]|uniref:class I SAM-dependent methyltransferase n=1 Tax=Halorarius litoreus TaxID=2962676 RepID=UPI0020CE5DAB|nr:class I SAM-dependent methyltransferase [Halorarius litoreus]
MDRDAVRRAWDAVADDYARRRLAGGEDTRLLDDLRELLPDDARVLDVGCGDGMRTLANLPAGSVGLDLSGRQLELARGNLPDVPLVQGEMTTLPFTDASVDAVTAYHAVFHVPRADHLLAYREFARVLRPGGYLLTTVGAGRYQTTRRGWLGSDHSMFFSTPGRAVTRTQLGNAGFDVVWERFVDDPLGSQALFVLAQRS